MFESIKKYSLIATILILSINQAHAKGVSGQQFQFTSFIAIPNSSSPTITRVPPGRFLFKHENNAFQWVLTDRAGVVFVLMNVPTLLGDRIKATLDIYGDDILFRPVISGSTDDLLATAQINGGSSTDIDFYWNGFDDRGFAATSGVYTVKIKLEIGSDKVEKVEKIMMTGNKSGEYWDPSGMDHSMERGCGSGFVLAFLPPLGFKFRRIFRKKAK